jgi:anti-sigma factor RsiW
MLALFGGPPAVRLAQVRLSHTTRKEPFRTVLAWIGRAKLGALAGAAALMVWQPGMLSGIGSGLAALLVSPEREEVAMPRRSEHGIPRRFGPGSPGW